ncbi:hypothetical protein R3P38DRAFT_3241330 [Favolaschia claudopus]|uniref:BZIP domain-containing protein n=1 Tax=Favolaschia claudopus TaxID=2862362 RepID=A0AAV9Z6F4_9AGAR
MGACSPFGVPPLKSILIQDEPTPHQVSNQRRHDRNARARARMAQKRALLKSRPPAVQEAYAEREREYQVRYREKHRTKIRDRQNERRRSEYKDRHGQQVYTDWLKLQLGRRRRTHPNPVATDPDDERDVVVSDIGSP